MSRNVLVAILGLVVFLVVAGAFYLEILAASRASDSVWMVVKPVVAGDVLGTDNVRRARVARTGDPLDYYTGDLLEKRLRAAHEMSAGTILFTHDVMEQERALVNLTLRTPPALSHGQPVDIYAQLGSQTVMVGRGLIVEQVGGTNNTNLAVWVPAGDEPAWITLQASNVALFAARSSGVGVPPVRALNMQDAISTLSGGGATGAPITVPVSPSPSPSKKP
jgi:hypothetical protein